MDESVFLWRRKGRKAFSGVWGLHACLPCFEAEGKALCLTTPVHTCLPLYMPACEATSICLLLPHSQSQERQAGPTLCLHALMHMLPSLTVHALSLSLQRSSLFCHACIVPACLLVEISEAGGETLGNLPERKCRPLRRVPAWRGLLREMAPLSLQLFISDGRHIYLPREKGTQLLEVGVGGWRQVTVVVDQVGDGEAGGEEKMQTCVCVGAGVWAVPFLPHLPLPPAFSSSLSSQSGTAFSHTHHLSLLESLLSFLYCRLSAEEASSFCACLSPLCLLGLLETGGRTRQWREAS